jgi:hypothetical protein
MISNVTLPRLGIPRTPIYPPLIAAAYVIGMYAASNVSVEALPRPLVVAIACGLVIQLILSAIQRNADRGAFVSLLALFVLMGLGVLTLILGTWLAAAAYIAIRRGRGLQTMPWLRATRILNASAVLTIVLVVANGAFDGAFSSSSAPWNVPRGTAAAGLPDIYLIMLDGYPRSDTLATNFDLDNRPFLSSMESLGFDVATDSHSNYDATVLTLASMFNGAQIPGLMPDPPKGLPAHFRAVTKVINQGARLKAFRQAGYELVSIPSGYNEGALRAVDRFIDSDQLSTFEMQLLTSGGTPRALAPLERTWLPDQHRARIEATFAALRSLAAERAAPPKLVFAHLLTPHMPIAFTKSGGAAEPLPCFPVLCTLFTYGDEYGASKDAAMRDQIEWVNAQVEATVRTIQARSANPPVIVIFSDHGMRNLPDDRNEMFRSFFLASTPGKTDIFPNNTTPVNMLTRLLNAYTGLGAPLSSEESYWSDTRTADPSQVFKLELWPVSDDLSRR